MPEAKIISRDWGKIDPLDIEDYIRNGGYDGFNKMLDLKPSEVISIICQSGLRGRSGCGFPTGLKWEFLNDATGQKSNKKLKQTIGSIGNNKNSICYLVCNAHEGEPETKKDKYILEKNPHQVLEGILIAAYTIRATKAHIAIKSEYQSAITKVKKAINQAKKKGFLVNLDVEVFPVESGYIGGEESALIEEIEGNRVEPRIRPPFVSQKGLYSKPTLVNNVETFANIPHILKNSPGWFCKFGTEKSPGTKLVTLIGDVKNPGVYEIELGTSLKEVIDILGGGSPNSQEVKLAQVGGYSGIVVPPDFFEKSLTFECKDDEIYIGSGTIFICDKTHKILDLMIEWISFFKDESCGKCTPCREGLTRILEILTKSKKKNQKIGNKIDLILEICNVLNCSSFCGLGVGASIAISSALEHFRNEL